MKKITIYEFDGATRKVSLDKFPNGQFELFVTAHHSSIQLLMEKKEATQLRDWLNEYLWNKGWIPITSSKKPELVKIYPVLILVDGELDISFEASNGSGFPNNDHVLFWMDVYPFPKLNLENQESPIKFPDDLASDK